MNVFGYILPGFANQRMKLTGLLKIFNFDKADRNLRRFQSGMFQIHFLLEPAS